MQLDLSGQVVFKPLLGELLPVLQIERREMRGRITIDWRTPLLRVVLEGVSAQEYLQAASRHALRPATAAAPEPERGPPTSTAE